MAHCKKQCALTKYKLGFENVTYKIWVLAYDKIELGNSWSNYGADAKSTPSYCLDLHFSGFQDRSEKGALMAFRPNSILMNRD